MKTKNIEKLKNLPQREKKFAKTKIALINALLEELETKQLSCVKIKDLVQIAEVSEPTFFNYFDSKQHMLIYFIQLWSIKMNILANSCERNSNRYIDTIKDIFRQASEEIVNHPQIMLEIISFQAQGLKLNPHTITSAEKWHYFPDVDGVENIEGMGLESILPPLITKAIESKELNKSTDADLLFLTLSSLFFGSSLLLLKNDPKALPDVLEAQLNIVLKSNQC